MTYEKQIAEVYTRISPYIRETPLLLSPYFSGEANANIFLKCENLQLTNAFKVRGVFSKITRMADKNKCIVTASAGNHGMAVAYAAKIFNMKAVIILPEFVPEFRIERIKKLGANVIIHGNSMDELNAKANEFTKDKNYFYLHGFDDEDVIAGQATIAYELLHKLPDLDVIVVSIGGGGLISGIARYAKAINPRIKIYGVETKGADSMYQSLQAGKIVMLPKITSVAISLGATKVAERTFEIVKKYVDKVVTVSDEEALRDLKLLLQHDKLLVEPASSCTISAILSHQLPDLAGKKIAAILSGGNFSLPQLSEILNATNQYQSRNDNARRYSSSADMPH